MRVFAVSLFLFAIFCSSAVFANHDSYDDDLIGCYKARISERDHFDQYGVRYMNPAGVLRQDRANYHAFRIRDHEDQYDPYFGDLYHRGQLKEMFHRGRVSYGISDAIMNGTPLVRVCIYRQSLSVSLLRR